MTAQEDPHPAPPVAGGQTERAEMSVWVEAWQMQCCGKPFTVGSRVSWTLRPADADYLENMLGAEAGGAIGATEDHHGADLDKVPATAGTVTAIAAVHCRYAPAPDRDERMLYPVASSGVQTAVQMADGWTADGDDLEFAGYLVRLAV